WQCRRDGVASWYGLVAVRSRGCRRGGWGTCWHGRPWRWSSITQGSRGTGGRQDFGLIHLVPHRINLQPLGHRFQESRAFDLVLFDMNQGGGWRQATFGRSFTITQTQEQLPRCLRRIAVSQLKDLGL